MIAQSLAVCERLLERAPYAVLLFEPHGRIVLANARAEQILGYSRDELRDRTVETLLPGLFGSTPGNGRESERSPLAVEPRHSDLRLLARGKNRGEIPVAASLHRTEVDGAALILALIRSDGERSPVEESVLNIAKGVSSTIGEAFFRSLAEYLAKALQADHAFIGELLETDLDRVRTIAVWADGKIVENFEYDLVHTPCSNVIRESLCSYPSGVQQAFPEDRFLAEMCVEGYVGTPLCDSASRALGLIVVLFNRPIKNPKLAESILQIFAVRAGAELERRRAEKALRHSEERWRRVYENSPFGIALTDPEGRFLAANTAYQRLLGYSEEELRALSWPDVTHEDDRESNLALCREFQDGQCQRLKVEKRYRRKDGEVLWASNTISRISGGEDCSGFVMAQVEDITERKRLQGRLEEEHERLRLLLDLTNNVLSHLDLRQLCQAISASIRRVMQCDFVALTLPDLEAGGMRLYTLDFPGGKGIVQEGALFPMEGTPSGLTFQSAQPQVFDAQRLAEFDTGINPGLAEGLKSGCFLPLIHRDRVLGTLNLCRLTDSVFTAEEVEFLSQIASQVAIAVDNALEYGQVSEARERLAAEKHYLEDEIRTEHDFGEIIGSSARLKSVLKQVEIVATTDATVLIHGETGTGKELIARAIHDLSTRAGPAALRWRTAAPCSSMRSGISPWSYSRSCCGYCRSRSLNAWAVRKRSGRTCAWWPRPIAI